MTNTKFRKRMLLSSVAMLLVALVALGSATFAWFSVRTDATATGLNGATTKTSSLMIRENTSGTGSTWANDITFVNATATSTDSMNPVTFDGSRWATSTAKEFNSGFAKDSTLTTTNVSMESHSHWSTVYVRYGTNTESTATKTLKVKVKPGTETTNSNKADDLKFARVALIPAAAESGQSVDWATGTSAKIFGAAADDRNKTGVWTGSSDATNSDTIVWGESMTAETFGTITEGKIYKMYACVYFEGTDNDCKDEQAGTNVNDFVITFDVA